MKTSDPLPTYIKQSLTTDEKVDIADEHPTILSEYKLNDIDTAINCLLEEDFSTEIRRALRTLSIIVEAANRRNKKQLSSISNVIRILSEKRWQPDQFTEVLSQLADIIEEDPSQNSITGTLMAGMGSPVSRDGSISLPQHENLLKEKFQEGYEAALRAQSEVNVEVDRLEL